MLKKSNYSPGLGIYSGIFAMYLQCQSNKSTGRMGTFVFYAICLLYILSTIDFVCDLVALIFDVSNNSICSKNIIFLSVVQSRNGSITNLLETVENTTSGCCDFLAQCILVRINYDCTYHSFYSSRSS